MFDKNLLSVFQRQRIDVRLAAEEVQQWRRVLPFHFFVYVFHLYFVIDLCMQVCVRGCMCMCLCICLCIALIIVQARNKQIYATEPATANIGATNNKVGSIVGDNLRYSYQNRVHSKLLVLGVISQ